MDLKGAEIFSVGTWNGLEFTTEDLQAIAASFTELALAGRVPLKFGHNDEQPVTDGQPALGWVERVWTEGGKLLADFANMPTVVFDAIKAQLYKFVSVELWQDAERDGSSYPWVLSAVALLGADEPAVGNLKDLAALTMRSTGLRWKASRTFATAEIPHSKRGARKTMEIDEKELSQLRADFAKAQADVAAVTAANTKLIEDGKTERATAIRKEVEAKFNTAIEAKTITRSEKDRYLKYTLPTDTERLLKFDLADVDAFIKEVSVAPPKKQTRGGGTTEDEEGKSPDVVVNQRTKALMSTQKGADFKSCLMQVLNDDPELADAYRFMPDNAS